MLEIKGKYCKDCKIFAETIEEEALSTVYGICDHPHTKTRIICKDQSTSAVSLVVCGATKKLLLARKSITFEGST